MANQRYGLKEVANVVFFDIPTGKPAIFFDTLKVSTIENESESAEARGGQGNNKLIAWDFGRTVTLTMQDALLSDVSLAMLAGTEVQTTDIKALGRETLAVADNAGTLQVTLDKEPDAGSVTVYKLDGSVMGEEIVVAPEAITGKVATVTGVTAGEKVMVFYEYVTDVAGATKVTFAGNKFPSTYKVVGETVVRDENGVDHKMQFVIPKAKLQSTFSLTMDVENVSTFDFNLEVLTEAGTNRLYDIIRL